MNFQEHDVVILKEDLEVYTKKGNINIPKGTKGAIVNCDSDEKACIKYYEVEFVIGKKNYVETVNQFQITKKS